jgi:selenium-binding protein 1
VPPLVTDIALSVDDRDLYVSCWGTGELKRFDVSDPRKPARDGSVQLGGIVREASHPAAGALQGGPQMVEVSARRAPGHLTNGRCTRAGTGSSTRAASRAGWSSSTAEGEGLASTRTSSSSTTGSGPHQVRLQGGDASSDSYCFP